jgi:uncharacterized membrane protein YkvA (DUF1232 family)
MNTDTGKFINYYELLGIDSKAGSERIKQAYRDKLKEWHPDRNADRIKEAEEVTKILNQAYHILSDSERRKQYDRILRYTRGEGYDKVLNEKEFWKKVEKASPALKKMLKNLKDLYTLFRDSIKGKYDLHPVTMGIIGGGLLYFVIPMDLMPDYLPVIGYLDDLTVLTTIANCFQDELKKYRIWKDINA